MPDRLDKLKEIVHELEAELASLDQVEPQVQQVLEEAVTRLHDVLGSKEGAALEAQSLAEQLQRAEAEFEVSHPTLSGIVVRVIHALGQLGI